MRRRPIVIALAAVVALAVLGAVALLVRDAERLSGGRSDEATRTGAADPAQTEVGGRPPDDFAWVYAGPLFGDGRPMQTYALQAGMLGGAGPLVDIVVPFSADADAQPNRQPAVSRIVRGSIVYVADDGHRSSVLTTRIARDVPPHLVAELDHVIWSIAVAPDGEHAYLAIVDRAVPDRDLGVVRLALDGGGIDQLVGPAAGAARPTPVRLAAVLPFGIELATSLDGRHLVRRACVEAVGCTADVIDLESGHVTPLGDRLVIGLAGGILVAQDCAGPAGCIVEAMDLGSGARRPLPGVTFEAVVALGRRGPVVAYVDSTQGVTAVRAINLLDGSAARLVEVAPGTLVSLMPSFAGARVAAPADYVLATVLDDTAGVAAEVRTLAIAVDGGEPIELPEPPVRPEFAEG